MEENNFNKEELQLIQNVLLNCSNNLKIKDTDLLMLIGKITKAINTSSIKDNRNKYQYVSVKYEDKFNPKTFNGKAYSYFTELNLEVGDIVIAPTEFGDNVARVSQVNIPEELVKNIIPCMKEITKIINKDRFLNYDEIRELVA